ncbi:MAG: hypothetical protein KDK51_09785 [Deltaproteobacteria bacterium]|nr:hypothetical protein [Deltaproteobacteria bacterium]
MFFVNENNWDVWEHPDSFGQTSPQFCKFFEEPERKKPVEGEVVYYLERDADGAVLSGHQNRCMMATPYIVFDRPTPVNQTSCRAKVKNGLFLRALLPFVNTGECSKERPILLAELCYRQQAFQGKTSEGDNVVDWSTNNPSGVVGCYSEDEFISIYSIVKPNQIIHEEIISHLPR